MTSMVGPRMHPLCVLILQSCGIICSAYKNLSAYLDHKEKGINMHARTSSKINRTICQYWSANNNFYTRIQSKAYGNVTTIIDEMRIKFYGYEDANKDAAMMHSVVSIALLFLTCIFWFNYKKRIIFNTRSIYTI